MVHVVSCRFLRLGCSDAHPREDTSTSSHEVPSDPQGYSGGEIHVFVTFSDDVSEVPLDDLVLCTYFESSREQQMDARLSEEEGGHTFRIGEVVVLPENVLPVWSRPDRVSDAKMQHLSKSAQRKTVLFVVDKYKVFHDSWRANGCVSHPQHGHLVANIFLLRGAPQSGDQVATAWQMNQRVQDHTVVVLWRQVSPALLLDSSWFTSPVESVIPVPGGLMDRNSSGSNSVNLLPPKQQHGDSRFEPAKDSYDINAFDVAAGSGNEFLSDDTGPWQQTTFANEMGFRVKSQYLLILWKVFTGIELRDVIFSANTISMYLDSRLKQAEIASRLQTRAQMEDIAVFFFRDIFGNVFIPPSCTRPPFNMGVTTASTFESTTIRVIVHLFLRALSSRAIDNLLRSAFQAGKDAPSKMQLQRLFISLVVDVYDTLSVICSEVVSDSDFLVEEGQSASLPMLVDDAISLLYRQKRFAALQPEILGLFKCQLEPHLLTNAVNGVFQVFTAQVRETIIASVTKQSDIVPCQRFVSRPMSSGQHLLRNSCKYRWLLEPESVHVRDTTDREILSNIKIADIAQFIREFGCTDLEIGENSLSVSLLSVFPFSDDTSVSPMKLVLDGRLRVFRVLPTGVSSMIATMGGWSIGDYMGSLADDAKSVDVAFYAYKEVDIKSKAHGLMTDNKATTVRRISLSLTLEKKQDGSQDGFYYPSNIYAFVDGTVFGSTYKQIGTHKLSEIISAERGKIWSDLDWTPLMEIRAGFVAVVQGFN
ncbi:hypothetical protein JG688_00005673 [Phytophthora aleatoria]|uniref:Uncharacterized protein n=1 Tax=Phytophthora aleatoria TaxID=2496075 RepID=A0A8J5IUQ1_9STRA|nr:hypothetical protein JG688_00005673 [Phytophthora aleatoria]